MERTTLLGNHVDRQLRNHAAPAHFRAGCLVTYTAVNPTVQYMPKSISESLNGAWVFGREQYFHFVKQTPVAKEH